MLSFAGDRPETRWLTGMQLTLTRDINRQLWL